MATSSVWPAPGRPTASASPSSSSTYGKQVDVQEHTRVSRGFNSVCKNTLNECLNLIFATEKVNSSICQSIIYVKEVFWARFDVTHVTWVQSDINGYLQIYLDKQSID